MKVLYPPLNSNTLGGDIPLQIDVILAKTYHAVKPDLGNTPAGIFYCCDLLLIG